MTPDKLSAKVETVIDKFESYFGKQVTKTQGELFDQIQILLNKLELNPDGTIIQNQANRKLLAKADVAMESALKGSGYYASLNQSAPTIGSLTAANSAYFKTLVDGFTPDAQYIKNLQKQTIGQLESMLANDGLEAAIKAPIRNILNQNVNTGASYSDLLKQLRTFIIGDSELDGKLKSYSGQIVTDTLFNYSRAMQESVSMKSGLQFVIYSGHAVRDSREFCIARMGKYFHKSEVEAWASLSWQGKRQGTTQSTIFIYAGGYRCNHQIIYVSELIVPKEVVERAKNAGFYR
jgi:hypothetical protein